MAYICGLINDEERKELERRGWEVEECPEELKDKEADGKKYAMVWVDASMFEVMDGPDWEKGGD